MFTSASTVPSSTTAPAAAPHQAVTQLYRAAIGSVNTPYYLQNFAGMDGAKPRTLSWNWGACLYTVNWMVYRGLWEAVFVYLASCLAVPLLIIGIGRLVFSLPHWLEVALLVACAALAFVIPGVLGNALFFGKCRDKISAALSTSDSLANACLVLSAHSATRKRLVWTIAINAGMLSVGISAAALLFRTSEPVAKRSDLPVVSNAPPSLDLITVNAATPAPSVPVVPVAPVESTSMPRAPDLVPVATATASDMKPVLAPKPAQMEPPAKSPTEPRPPKPPRQTPAVYVNVGIFGNPSNANRAIEKLTAADLPPVARVVTSAKGDFTRVRAGPFVSATEAKAAVVRIKALGLDAVVARP